MADDQDKPPGPPPTFDRGDVPMTNAIVKSRDEAKTLARRIVGEVPPDECRFHCAMCGWNKTLKFEADEIAALGGDITSYGGPCAECGNMTLVPYTHLMGEEFTPAYAKAQENARKQYEEQADVFLEKAVDKVTTMMGGGAFTRTDGAVPEADEPPLGDLKPRKSE